MPDIGHAYRRLYTVNAERYVHPCVCMCMCACACSSGLGTHRIKSSLHAVLQLQTFRVIQGYSRGHLAYRTAALTVPLRVILLNRENTCKLSLTALHISSLGSFAEKSACEWDRDAE